MRRDAACGGFHSAHNKAGIGRMKNGEIMRRHAVEWGLRVDAHQREKVSGGSMRTVSYGVYESGPLVMLQPHQHVARDLLRLVFMHEMSRVGDRHHRQVVDELIQPIKILTDECLIS